MAERVDFRRESRTREAIISILKTHKIMEESKIRHLMQKWEHYEYKIAGVNRNLPVYCEYIKYLEALLKTIRTKPVKPSIKEALENYLKSDIKKLINTCMTTPAFHNDFDLFMLKLSFCNMTDDFIGGSATVDALIKAHPTSVKTWREAANCFMRMDKREYAIHILQKGLDILGNPVNTELYLFLLTLEITHALGEDPKKLTKERSDAGKAQLVPKLNVYLTDFKTREFKDSAFLFEMLHRFYEIEIEHSLIERLQDIITDKCGHFSQTWGRLIELDLNEVKNKSIPPSNIIERFQKGLVKLAAIPTELRLLYNIYLDLLLDVVAQNMVFSYEEAMKYLTDTLNNAADLRLLEEKYYLDWFDLSTDDQFDSVLDRSLKDYPHSVELWNVKLNCDLMRYGQDERTLETFEKATEACGEESIELWNSLLRHMYVNWDSNHIEEIYRKGMNLKKQPDVIIAELKPRFIEWLAIAKDSDIAMQEYHILSEQTPYCKRLHDVALTLKSFSANEEITLKAHNLLCKQFSKDSDVYFRFARFYHQSNINTSIMTRKEAIQKIYQDARTNLDDKALDEFLKLFNDLKGKEMVFVPII